LKSEASLVSSTVAFGHPGLNIEYASRLQEAYEQCSYLDYHHSNPAISRRLSEWKHRRSPLLASNPGAAASELSLDWMQYEFSNYVENRRCLFVGGEADLLRELHTDPCYREAAKKYWPSSVEAFFLQTGRIGDGLDQIKASVSEQIVKNKIDTVFMSLGGGAKILCFELAKNHEIAAFDFGGLLRGLTYSGSEGQSFVRATHYPFFFRVRFDTYMGALLRAFPALSAEQILAKAHAQLALELIRKEEGWTAPSEWVGDDCLDTNSENLKHFWDSYSIYCRDYKPLGQNDLKAAAQVDEFERWRRYRGVGIDGKLVRFIFSTKVATRRLASGIMSAIRPHG
jgi:hypothetical protein